MSEKQVVEVNISGVDSFFKGLKDVQFCRETCPIPKKTWSCGCRPMKHQNECQILKAYNKRSGKMKNIKIKKCKNCKGTGMVQIAEGKKGLVACPVCKGAGTIETETEGVNYGKERT